MKVNVGDIVQLGGGCSCPLCRDKEIGIVLEIHNEGLVKVGFKHILMDAAQYVKVADLVVLGKVDN